MTLRIERRRSGDTPIVQLIGEFDVDPPMITLPPLNR
jgi:hypothetical protein